MTEAIRQARPRRPLVWLAFAAGAGTLAGMYIPGSVLWVWPACAALLCLLTLFFRPKGMLLTAAAMIAVMLTYAARTAYVMNAPLPPAGDYTVKGVVLQEAKLSDNSLHMSVQLRDVTLTDANGTVSRLDGLYWTAYIGEDFVSPAPGSTVRVTGRLYEPSGQRNPDGFDFRMYLKQNHLSAGLYNSGDFETVPDAPVSPRAMAIRVRYAMLERLDEAFSECAVLPKALLLGEREALSMEEREAFARAGIAHVLAVSGLHISLIVAALSLILRHFLSAKKQLWFFAAFLLMYAALLDFRASVVRASILTFTFLLVRSHGRAGDSLSGLSLAFMIILILSPADLAGAGFQLSFAAALGIVLLNQPVRRITNRVLGRKAGGLVSSTLSAVAGTALPSIQTFHCFSVAGLVFSPVVCALLAYLLPLCLAVLALSFLWTDAARVLAWPVGRALQLMLDGVSAAAQWPYMSVNCPSIPWPFFPLIGAMIYLCSSYAPERLKGMKRLAILSALFIAGAAIHVCTLDLGVSYLQLDVGSADCAIIQDGRDTAVIDCGEDGRDLCAYLLARGRRVNTLVITHLHADHLFGAKSLMDHRIPIDRLVLPAGADTMAVSEEALQLLDRLKAYCGETVTVAAGDSWQTARTQARALWPEQDSLRPGADANDYSLCLEYKLNQTVLLLTGDLTGTYEPYIRAKADILKAAHHGSKRSSTAEFLAFTSPQAALISVSGTANAARADSEVQTRLREAGADIYTTADCGAIRLDMDRSGCRISRFIKEGNP